MSFASQVIEVSDLMAAQEYFHSRKMTDGLPVVPPTEDAVQAALDWALLTPDQVIGVEPVRARPITAEKLAINSVIRCQGWASKAKLASTMQVRQQRFQYSSTEYRSAASKPRNAPIASWRLPVL